MLVNEEELDDARYPASGSGCEYRGLWDASEFSIRDSEAVATESDVTLWDTDLLGGCDDFGRNGGIGVGAFLVHWRLANVQTRVVLQRI